MNNTVQIMKQNAKGEVDKTSSLDNIIKKSKKIEALTKSNQQLLVKIGMIRSKVDPIIEQQHLKLDKARELNIRAYLDKLKDKATKPKQSIQIETILTDIFKDIQSEGRENDRFDELQKEYVAYFNSTLSDTDKKESKEYLKKMFAEMGVEMEADFDFESVFEEDFQSKFKQKAYENNFEEQTNQTIQTKTTNVNIDFQKLYKKLAKICHPDLVQDPKAKQINEEKMKRLTAAWESKEYGQILLLWMEMDPDNASELILNENNIRLVISDLNEKIRLLEFQDFVIKRKDPKTSFYYEYFNQRTDKALDKKIKDYCVELQEDIEMIDENTKFILNVKKGKCLNDFLNEQSNPPLGFYW